MVVKTENMLVPNILNIRIRLYWYINYVRLSNNQQNISSLGL